MVAVKCLEKYNLEGFFLDYGQRYAEQEQWAASNVARRLGIKLHSARLTGITVESENEWFPARNLYIGALSFSMASRLGCSAILVGSKTNEYREDDEYCWHDCTRVFHEKLQELGNRALDFPSQEIEVLQPLLGWSKQEVVDGLKAARIPLHELWSCYRPDKDGRSCGVCYHCVELKKLGVWECVHSA